MKDVVLFFLLLLISSFHLIISARKYNGFSKNELRQLIAILEEDVSVELDEEFVSFGTGANNEESIDYKGDVSPNDQVDVKLWNYLNAKDIQNKAKIENYADENAAINWLKWYLRIEQRYSQINELLGWNYETNITKANQQAMTAQSLIQAPFSRETLTTAKNFNDYMKNSTNEDVRRIFRRLSAGFTSDNDADVRETSKLHAELESIYAKTKVCETNNPKKCHTIEPYLEQLMQTEKDYDRLTWAWKGWHDNCGDKIRPIYLSFIDHETKNAKKNGYKDLSDAWIEEYEMGNTTEFESIIDGILKEIMPLYKQIHAYVRGRLCNMYPGRVSCTGPIPVHLLGNMWAQQWHDRFDDLIPYPDAPLTNMTKILLEKKFTVHQMYTTAENFFTSVGLYPMTDSFWARSMFKKPTDRDVVCHASAMDMAYKDDYRVKICTEIDSDYFYTVHHEMGHVEYYMAYDKHQPYVYRDGANSGFHEAIGDTIGMYAVSPAHLIRLGFLDKAAVNQHYQINFLLYLALQKVAFLPFAYVMDKYRFKLFRNETDREHALNSMWWALRIEHGGIMAAVPRSDKTNFDAGAKYHIPANVPYLRYFIANILQFQFYRGMCRLQGQTTDLYMCDIYGNKAVGEKFKAMLAMGNSKPWSEVLESLTGEKKLEPKAILDFFDPLYKWLQAENAVRGHPIGWM